MNKLKIVTLILITFYLFGCASTQREEQKLSRLHINKPIYGLLENTNSGYQFTEFRTTPTNEKKPWVNLKGGYLNNKLNSTRCGIGLLKGSKGELDCSIIVRDDMFMEKELDGFDAFARVILSPFFFGATLTGATFDVNFDQESFDKAYSEAFKALNIEELKKVEIALVALDDNYRKIVTTYDKATSSSLESLGMKINDKSGFYAGRTHFKDLVTITKNNISRIPTIHANTPLELHSNIQKQSFILASEWKKQSSTLNISCNNKRKEKFVIRMRCKNTLPVVDGRLVGTIDVDIIGINIDRVFANHFDLKDESLQLSFSNNLIGFTNLTSQFINIDSVAVYYQDKIAKSRKLDLEMAPNSTLNHQNKLKLIEFPIEWNLLEFKALTKKEAMKQELNFGFAIKYRVINTSVEKTLYLTKEFPLIELISG